MRNDHAVGRAQFGGAALAGARRFDPAELLDDVPQMGLVREATYCWGTCRNGAGDLFIFAPRMAAPSGAAGRDAAAAGAVQHSMSDRFILQSTIDGASHPRLRREGRFTATSDDVQRSREAGSAAFRIQPHDGRGTMELVAGKASASYREADVLSLSGPRIGDGLHWYLPHGRSAVESALPGPPNQLTSAIVVRGLASGSSFRMMASTSSGRAGTSVVCGPRCQPSAMARTSPEDSMT
jgi:hypothetical protein